MKNIQLHVQTCRFIEKMNQFREFSKEIGIENISVFKSGQKEAVDVETNAK